MKVIVDCIIKLEIMVILVLFFLLVLFVLGDQVGSLSFFSHVILKECLI